MNDFGCESDNFALKVADALGAALALGMLCGKQVGTPDGEVLELLVRGAFAHGALARRGSLLANAGLRIVASLGSIVLGREDRGVARGSRRRVRRSVRVGSGTLAADGWRHQSESSDGDKMRLAKHRLLECSGVGGKVVAIELNIVRDGH